MNNTMNMNATDPTGAAAGLPEVPPMAPPPPARRLPPPPPMPRRALPEVVVTVPTVPAVPTVRAPRRPWSAAGFLLTLAPVFATPVAIHFLVPNVPDPRAGSALGRAIVLANGHLGLTAAALFLLLSALAAYWRAQLPSARRAVADRAQRALPRRPTSWRRTVLLVFAAMLAAFAGIAVSRFVWPARIVSTSMVPTILPGDRVWVDTLAYRGHTAPRRGDVIVLHHAAEGEGVLAKRVIGLPGDKITMIDNHPVINGVTVPSCDAGTFVYFGANRSSRGRLIVEWLDGRAYLTVQDPSAHAFDGYQVAPGEVFVLGDNRGVSNDSRSWKGSSGVAFADIEGRVERVIFGDERGGALDWGRFAAPLGTDLRLSGVDLAPLRAGIDKCLRDPPAPVVTSAAR